MDLEVSIDHVSYHDLAMAFEKVSGHPARYIDTSLDEYWKTGPLAFMADKPCGYNSDPKDPAHMSMRDNFSGFWNLWANSGGNAGVVKRNYGLLDEIFPGRVSNAEQWFRDEQERGLELGLGSLWDRVNEMKPVLKGSQDGMKGRLQVFYLIPADIQILAVLKGRLEAEASGHQVSDQLMTLQIRETSGAIGRIIYQYMILRLRALNRFLPLASCKRLNNDRDAVDSHFPRTIMDGNSPKDVQHETPARLQ
ncbi:NmrA family protein [Venturia nashicola]|uniref:NmrA family protein n=1 Tax=Venturia nashicola TaxID=86259 RepID=A0A4Z1PIM7_9PEZI|nr:NmrA family protein [Venturia nashicola]